MDIVYDVVKVSPDQVRNDLCSNQKKPEGFRFRKDKSNEEV
jgi:hypothetical protein